MQKKIIMINGSPRKNGGTTAAFHALKDGMKETGAAVTEYHLNDLAFKGCQGCMGCKRAGSCVVKDDLSPVLKDIKSADAVVLGSPIYMFAISGQLSMFLNRLYSLIDGSYQPYAGKTRLYMSVYSMGSPSASYTTSEANRVRQAMDMLGFKEVDRLTMTGVFPGMRAFNLQEREYEKIKERGLKFAETV